MSKLQIQETIQAPIEKVFARATDFANAAQVIQGIDKIEILSDGPVGPGTRFKETRILFGREATEEMTIGRWAPPHSYTLDAASHGCRYESHYQFKKADSATEVTMTFTATPLTTFAKIMAFLTKPLLKSMVKMCAKDLADLKKAVEGSV